MKSFFQTYPAIILAMFLFKTSAEATPVFEAGKDAWHGFDRYDFIMDEETLAISPYKKLDDEGDGVKDAEKGKRRCIVVVPKEFAAGNPWSWQGCYWNHQPQAEIELLRRGFCIAYISANERLRPGKEWDAWYAFLTAHGLSAKPAFVGMSRGGEFEYTWATAHPTNVSCIYGDNPYVPAPILMKLGALATNDVPLLHVCGSLDPLLENSSTAVENIYQQFGGRISVMIKDGFAHHPHSLRDPKIIADFIEASVQETKQAPPAFVGDKVVKRHYYSAVSSYKKFPKEGASMTLRGPVFTGCYDQYQFQIPEVKTFVTVIAPKVAAAGNPWVFRADFPGREAAVDLALLDRGFHIVTGPVPYDDGPVPAEWDTTYRYLVAHGFSKKPVMEGDGAAAGEAFAWAMANPGNVSSIYAENPIMHSNLSKIPLFDSLGILAKAGMPLMSVCGSLDPNLDDNTRVIEKRYRKLGGKIQVRIKQGQGHYRLAPNDTKPAVDFIIKSVAQ